MATTPLTVTSSSPLPDLNKQAKAALPKVTNNPEDYLDQGEPSGFEKGFRRGIDSVTQPINEKVLKPFRKGLDVMGEDLEHAGERGYTAGGTQLPPMAAALVKGVGTLLRWAPVGENVGETVMANVIPPELGPEERAALRAKKVIEDSKLVYKGELVPGSQVHMFEHPEHPGKTAALHESKITPESVKSKMDSKLAEFGEPARGARAMSQQVAEKPQPVAGTKPPAAVKPKLGPGGDFYSTLEHTIESKLPDKFSGQQLLSTLKNAGVSKAELEHVGIQDFAANPTVTKDEILSHVRERTPHVETVEKSQKTASHASKKEGQLQDDYNDARERSTRHYEVAKRQIREASGKNDQYAGQLISMLETATDPEKVWEGITQGWPKEGKPDIRTGEISYPREKHDFAFETVNKFLEAKKEARRLSRQLDSFEGGYPESGSGPKYESYTLPGGSNYREVLLKLPQNKNLPENVRSYDEEMTGYQGPHFDEPNVVAHLRLKDRTDVNGKKTLFIEELQSDWAREIREQKSEGFGSEEAAQRREAGGVPSMPFDKSWHELALKKALKIAADEGYDQVAWTTGEQQAQRYNLRNHFDDITYQENGTLSATPKEGRTVHQQVSPEELHKYVGKENADKLLGQLETRPGRRSRIARLQLDEPVAMGGEHHLRLYDEMVPQFLNKYTKKWGGQVGTTEIDVPKPYRVRGEYPETHEVTPAGKTKVQALPITPELRAKVKEGQPLIGADKLDFSSIPGHVEHELPTSARIAAPLDRPKLEVKPKQGLEESAAGEEPEIERLRRLGVGSREATPKTKEEVEGEAKRVETKEAEERVSKQPGLPGSSAQIKPEMISNGKKFSGIKYSDPLTLSKKLSDFQDKMGNDGYVKGYEPESRELKIKDLNVTQQGVDPEAVKDIAKKTGKKGHLDPIVVVHENGKNYVVDGHHRLANMINRGDDSTVVDYYDFDKKKSQDKLSARIAAPLDRPKLEAKPYKGPTDRKGFQKSLEKTHEVLEENGWKYKNSFPDDFHRYEKTNSAGEKHQILISDSGELSHQRPDIKRADGSQKLLEHVTGGHKDAREYIGSETLSKGGPQELELFTKKMEPGEDHVIQTISRLHGEPLVDLKVGKQTLKGVKLPFDLKTYHGGPEDVKKIEPRSGDVPGLRSTSLADRQLAEIAAENFEQNRPYKPGKVHEITIPKGNYVFYDPEMKLGTTDTATHLRIFKDVTAARDKLSGKVQLAQARKEAERFFEKLERERVARINRIDKLSGKKER